MELKQKEEIKKIKGGFEHIINVKYPQKNYDNMMKSWKETVEKQEEWLNNYDEYLKQAEQSAEKVTEEAINQKQQYFDELEAMNDKERFEYWNSVFLKEKEKFEEDKKNKEEIIKEQFENNKKILEQYKNKYKEEMRQKKNAIKKWMIK